MVKKLVPVTAPEQQLIAQRPSMINQAPGGLLSGEIPGILNLRAHREPIARCYLADRLRRIQTKTARAEKERARRLKKFFDPTPVGRITPDAVLAYISE